MPQLNPQAHASMISLEYLRQTAPLLTVEGRLEMKPTANSVSVPTYFDTYRYQSNHRFHLRLVGTYRKKKTLYVDMDVFFIL